MPTSTLNRNSATDRYPSSTAPGRPSSPQRQNSTERGNPSNRAPAGDRALADSRASTTNRAAADSRTSPNARQHPAAAQNDRTTSQRSSTAPTRSQHNSDSAIQPSVRFSAPARAQTRSIDDAPDAPRREAPPAPRGRANSNSQPPVANQHLDSPRNPSRFAKSTAQDAATTNARTEFGHDHAILFQTFFKSSGTRTYAAPLKEASNTKPYLVVTEARRPRDSDDVRKTRLMVFDEDFAPFFRMMHEVATHLRAQQNETESEARNTR